MNDYILAFLILFFIVLLFLSLNIKIVKNGEKAIVERLGAYYKVIEQGLYFTIPFIERVVHKQFTENLEVVIHLPEKDHTFIPIYIKYDIDLKLFYYQSFKGENKLFEKQLLEDFSFLSRRNEFIKVEQLFADEYAPNYYDKGIIISQIDIRF
jgi:hypothetical protein